MMKKQQIILMLLMAAAITATTAIAADSPKDTPTAVTSVSSDELDTKKAEFKQAIPQAAPAESKEFKWGGDIRLRHVSFDHIPYANGGEARGGQNIFQRYRTRLFGEYHPNDELYFRARLVNEWRTVQEPSDTRNGWAAFDETVFDNLFVDYKHDMFDVRVGRQDMIYGTGKLILDGTPLDGSRTIYFDAAKVVYKGIDDTTVDLFGMYTESHDPLAIHSQDRSMVGYTPGYDGVEAGFGVYIKNKSTENLPWEGYYISKTKQQEFPTAQEIEDPINTFGARLMPKTDEGVIDGNLEMAYQSTPDMDAFMIDALASWNFMKDMKGKLGLGWYHLSEDWNPIFARWPQYSELYVYSFDTTGAGQWKNISMPHLDFSLSPAKFYKADFLLGYMMAPQDDGPGTGNIRGLLFTWWNRFTIKEKLFSQRDKLGAHILLELMQPGSYYTPEQRDNTASFLRFELTYSF